MKFFLTIFFVSSFVFFVSAQSPEDFPAAQALLHQWNSAISEHHPEKLKAVYAPTIKFYLQNMPADDCIKTKSDWLVKHSTYQQEIKNICLYTLAEEGVTNPDIIAEFKKICKENGASKEYNAMLVFRKINKEWKLVQETDIITEVNLFNKAPIFNLPRGHYHFTREYWENVGEDENLAHEMVSYSYDLEIDITEEGIRGTYDTYSGRLRSITHYALLSGSMAEGILQIDMAMILDDDGDLAEETEIMNFKVVNAHQIVLLDKEMSWLYGKVMTRLK